MMKKAFTANTRMDRFSYLRDKPIVTDRLLISPLRPREGAEFCDFLLRDNRGYISYIGQGWMEYPGKLPEAEFTPYLGEGLITHLNKKMNFLTMVLAIREMGSGEIIGMLDVYKDHNHNARVSYYLCKDARGQGYAREAIKAIHNVIERYEHQQVSYAETAPDNKSSKALLIGLGFRPVGKFISIGGSSMTGRPVLRFIR